MPYIPDIDRHLLKTGKLSSVDHPGKLNYLFTEIIKTYIENKSLSYKTINDILGALEGAKLEFYRRIVVPYENTKISLNGDVY